MQYQPLLTMYHGALQFFVKTVHLLLNTHSIDDIAHDWN